MFSKITKSRVSSLPSDKADMNDELLAQSTGVQPSLRGLWSTECGTVAAVTSSLSQSARTTELQLLFVFQKGISDVETCCQPPRFIFYSRLE